MCTTIVVPCFNEARRLQPAGFREFRERHPEVSFIFVDDGSTDATRAVLETMHGYDPDGFRLIALARNSGKAEAVRAGVLEAIARGATYVGFWDADLSTPLSAIPTFTTVLDERPDLLLVMGARVQLLGRMIVRRPIRHYAGRVFATAASLVLQLPVYDTQCGAKLFRVTAGTRSLFDREFVSRWVFDVEMLARLLAISERGGAAGDTTVYELPLVEWRDVLGSKLRMRDFIRAAIDLARIRRRYPLGRPTRRRASARPDGGTLPSPAAPAALEAVSVSGSHAA